MCNCKISERSTVRLGREEIANKAGIRVAGAIEQQSVRGETPGKVQIVTRENHTALFRPDSPAQRFQTINLMMHVEMRERFVKQQ